MFSKVLVANRGEIAVRIARTCKELGVGYTAVYSDADANARYVAVADEAVRLPGVAPTDTYLNVDAVLDAARSVGADGIHPGYGFLSENADFAEAVREAGFVWIGPSPEAIRAIGDKIRARRIAESAGVPIVPGTLDPVSDVNAILSFGDEHGYPVAIKASGGGGGRGLKVARGKDEVEPAFQSAKREAAAYFSNDEVFVERYLENPKHLEVQLLAPNPDEALWLGVRDCSLQRRHQKLVEETPPPLFAERAPDMGQAAVSLSKACGYVNAGTVELLVDRDGSFYFLEVNARLQVEHTVTEEVLGIDLVACQLKIASGEPLGFTQDDVAARGHAIECRINAEDPTRDFIPTPGRLDSFVEPNGLGVRVDSGYATGDTIPDAYDSLLAKLVTWGKDRDEARLRMLRCLDEMKVEGVATTIPAHKLLLGLGEFVTGAHTTKTVESGVLDELASVSTGDDADNVLLVGGRGVRLWSPAMAPFASAAVSGGMGGGEVVAPMQGTIIKILAEKGQEVEAGEALVVLEAMKMETTIAATKSGVVQDINVSAGATVASGDVVAVVE